MKFAYTPYSLTHTDALCTPNGYTEKNISKLACFSKKKKTMVFHNLNRFFKLSKKKRSLKLHLLGFSYRKCFLNILYDEILQNNNLSCNIAIINDSIYRMTG